MEPITCKNCDNRFEGHYCNNCGQRSDIGRFTSHNLLHEFLYGFFHVKARIIYTIKELFLEPGVMLRSYIDGKRVGQFNPFTYLIIICIIGRYLYAHSNILEHSGSMFLSSRDTLKFTATYFSYRMLLFIPIYSVISLYLQRAYKYNLAEELIINAYIISQTVLIQTFWLLLSDIMEPSGLTFSIMVYCAYLTGISYQIYVFTQLFNKGSLTMRIFKGSVTALCGFVISFFILNGIFYLHRYLMQVF